MRRVCVFCGSSKGVRPSYVLQMEQLALALVGRGLELVYGGGNIGLMGIVADTVLANGGKVIGIIPQSLLDAEVAHPDLTELHVVKDMHERKAMMAEYSDAFVAAPGGIGTLEEMFEIWTWGQLGLHTKPLGFYDIDGYFTPLLSFLDHMVDQGFVHDRHRQMAIRETDPAQLLDQLKDFKYPGSIFSAP